jgi:hypothetical protein
MWRVWSWLTGTAQRRHISNAQGDGGSHGRLEAVSLAGRVLHVAGGRGLLSGTPRVMAYDRRSTKMNPMARTSWWGRKGRKNHVGVECTATESRLRPRLSRSQLLYREQSHRAGANDAESLSREQDRRVETPEPLIEHFRWRKRSGFFAKEQDQP